MKIPDVTSTGLEEAMNRFDKELRNTGAWNNWTQDHTHKYAIERANQLYPVKQIIYLATGTPLEQFDGGNQANSFVERHGFKIAPLRANTAKTWIFQGDPTTYDVRAAVRKLSRITWRLNQHKDDVETGHHVYLWESGSEAGIVAVAEISAKLPPGPMREEELPFLKQKDKLETETDRVELRITGIVERTLTRTEIASHSELANLLILRQPRGTNFSVERTEAEALEKLLQDRIASSGLSLDLRNPECLRRLYRQFLEEVLSTDMTHAQDESYARWWQELTAFLQMVSEADQTQRATIEFQERVWEKNSVSAVGQGFIPVDKALADPEFRNWIAAQSIQQLPQDRQRATEQLTRLFSEMANRLKPHCRQVPYLKICRVLTAFFPRYFTTIADRGKLNTLHSAMFGSGNSPTTLGFTYSQHPVGQHANILKRLDDVLGPTPTDFQMLVQRITFPWYLYTKLPAKPESNGKPPVESPSLAALADDLLIEASDLERVIHLLTKKKQIIFYGPPGTGKTFVARKLAHFLAGSDERIEKIQFHPSYAYEDFVEGYRPSISKKGQSGFSLIPGPLKRLAANAMSNSNTHVLLIDEVNRGNLAKVFGELYYLLEYRDEKMSLLYSKESFTLPHNLLIIATMNTADRSIALLDAALRRRFYFVPFFPDRPPVQGLLLRWLNKNKPDLAWLADVVDLANRKLQDPHVAIGPSHFMDSELNEDLILLIWQHSVLPHIAEHFFGQEDRMAEFDFNKLRKAVEAN